LSPGEFEDFDRATPGFSIWMCCGAGWAVQLATRNATLLGRVPILRGLHKEGPAGAVEYMGMGQNPIPLVNIKIAGIYGCSSP
jgi:hypothetical protein